MKAVWNRIVFFYLFIKLFTKRHLSLLTSAFVIGFFITLLSYKFFPVLKTLVFPNKKVIGIVGEYTPTNLPLSIQGLIGSGLTKISPDGSPIPALASSWESTDSGRLYLFHLKPNLLWHDGKTFIASDVKYTIKDATVTSPDDNTLKIELKEPFSPLPVVLSRPIFRPNLIGLGIYRVTNLKYKAETITPLTLSPLKDDLPILEYKFYPTMDEAILAFKIGEINTLMEVPISESFSSWKNVKITPVEEHDRFLGIFYNTKDDLLKDKESRQGLTFAIPSFDDRERLYSPISSSSWAYYNKVRIYKNDPENAQRIIDKTPLATSSAEITLSTYALYLPIAQKVADAWNKIGVKTKVKVETVLPSDYQAILLAQEIPSDPDQYQFWHSKEIETNLSHYSNLKIDKLLEDGRKTLDLDKRKKIYADFQRYLVDDDPVAFLFFPKVYTVERL